MKNNLGLHEVCEPNFFLLLKISLISILSSPTNCILPRNDGVLYASGRFSMTPNLSPKPELD